MWLTGRMLACQSRGLGFSRVVAEHAFNPSIRRQRQEDLLSSWPAWFTKQVLEQPGLLYREDLS